MTEETTTTTTPPATPPATTPPATPPAPSSTDTRTLEQRIEDILKKQTPPQPSEGDLEAKIAAIISKRESQDAQSTKISELEKTVKELQDKLSGTHKRPWWEPWTALGN
jgi:hypothetical protein